MVDGAGEAVDDRALTPVEYAGWVDWIDPLSGEAMGRARQAGGGRQGSPRFAEMVVNAPKSLSIAAALHPDVSAALDAAQRGRRGRDPPLARASTRSPASARAGGRRSCRSSGCRR